MTFSHLSSSKKKGGGGYTSSKPFSPAVGLSKAPLENIVTLMFLMFSLRLCASRSDSGRLYLPTSLE